jgi:hypothetical protein
MRLLVPHGAAAGLVFDRLAVAMGRHRRGAKRAVGRGQVDHGFISDYSQGCRTAIHYRLGVR